MSGVLLKSLLGGLIVTLVLVVLVAALWVAALLIHAASIGSARYMNVTPHTSYYSAASNVVKGAAWVIPIAAVGVMIVYGIHLRRR